VDPTFDVLGGLPAGRVAIEASAGTGKTYTLAALATRYLAEQPIAASELLIVTFTRAATAELRSRVREQLVRSAAVLRGEPVEGGPDALSDHLAAVDPVERRVRLARLEAAVSDFDAAVISTMHGFAAQLRSTLGLSAAIDPDARLSAEVSSVVKLACADALAGASVSGFPFDDLPTLDKLVTATEVVVGAADMDLQPVPGTPGATDEQFRLFELVTLSLANLRERRVGSGTMGFDDVLSQLRDALLRSSATAVLDALRSRFAVILIDEFQDTDSVQWEIFSTLYDEGDPRGALVLVGDPKQAIYRFRGADIDVYLGAVAPSTGIRRYTLGTNWRSDGRALRAQRLLFDGATFGNPAIGYVEVGAAPVHEDLRMMTGGGDPFPGLEIRVPLGSTLPRTSKGPDAGKTARILERDMVAHIRDLLDRAWIPTAKDDDTQTRLRPSDIAVLVSSGNQARSAQAALWRQGVPAVIAGGGSVLSSWAADQMRILLYAMEKPSDLRRVRSFALSWFASWPADRVATASDDELRELQEKLSGWSTRLADHPVAEVLAHVWASTGVVEHLLGEYGGDRHVTDLDHLAEFLCSSAPHGLSGVAGLQALLDTPPESSGDIDVDGDVVARRIESEVQAVQVMTIWKSKGLEFPVVCLPGLWRPGMASDTVVSTDPATGRRTLDLARGTSWPDKPTSAARKAASDAEYAGERLRLLYVALTRARHHTAVWWSNSTQGKKNPLSRFLFARDPGTGLLDPSLFTADVVALPDEDLVAEALDPLQARSGGAIAVDVVADRPVPDTPWIDTVEPPSDPELVVEPFIRDLPRDVHRWSFSSITLRASESVADPYDVSGSDVGSTDEDTWGEADAPRPSSTDDTGSTDRSAAFEGPLARLQAGTTFGTFVHGVLERVAFDADPLEPALRTAIDGQRAHGGLDVSAMAPAGTDAVDELVDGLAAAIRSPLGPLFHGRTLAELPRRRRLDELAFDLRVGDGGRHPTGRDVGRLVVHHLPPGHLLGRWATDLAAGSIDVTLAGYLTGSIDLVAQVPGDDPGGGYVVADYKTNQLRPWGAAAGPDDYGVRRMAEAMAEHHYPLQALLYAVALHRYLRWKVPHDTLSTRVTGAAYLFVRGMTGPGVAVERAHPHGVFTVALPPGLVTGLSDLLAGADPGWAAA
jgi:exodeoxyribonuclease V beta subunit